MLGQLGDPCSKERHALLTFKIKRLMTTATVEDPQILRHFTTTRRAGTGNTSVGVFCCG